MENTDHNQQINNQEKERIDREVVLHFIRHGAAGYSEKKDYEGYLTEKGKEQACERAEELFDNIPPKSVLAIYSSPRLRTKQTAEAIEQKLQELNQKSDKQLTFHNFIPKVFNKVGLNNEATDKSLELMFKGEDPIKEWLQNPNKTTAEFEMNFTGFLKKFSGLAKHMKLNGPDLHVIIVSHTGPSEIFAAKLLRTDFLKPLANCEEFKIELPVFDKKPYLTYKDIKSEITI